MTHAAQAAQAGADGPARDMAPSAFAVILDEIVSRIGGAYACVLVDRDGEAVDYAGQASPFDIRMAGAHARIVLQEVERGDALSPPRWIQIRAERKSLVIRALPDGYALALLLRKSHPGVPLTRAWAACEYALAREAGWVTRPEHSWRPINVACDERDRPAALGRNAVSLEILGTVVGLRPTERGYRIRIHGGLELTIVEERLARHARSCPRPGHVQWYAEGYDDELSERA